MTKKEVCLDERCLLVESYVCTLYISTYLIYMHENSSVYSTLLYSNCSLSFFK